MNDRRECYSPAEINSIFDRLDPQDVERFYQSYQLWTLQQQIAELQTQITTLHLQIAENNERMQQSHPSAIALATLARLQSHGVTDIDLLDRMLERGEAWLDQTMQRLAYCEQFDFIRNNYTDWCQHALEGAYDWIDSMQNSTSPSQSTSAIRTDESLDEATEEKLLQKLMSEEEAFMLESTLKRPAIPPQPEEQAQSGEVEQAAPSEDVEVEPASSESNEPSLAHEENTAPAPDVPLPISDTTSSKSNEPLLSERSSSSHQTASRTSAQRSNNGHLQAAKPRKKRSFLLRLIAAFFHR